MTEDSKAHRRFPLIDDAHVNRAVKWLHERVGTLGMKNVDVAQVRGMLEAALDRRVGPKCRRVENADNCFQCPSRRNLWNRGRRKGDVPSGNLPRKSSRLARESAEKAAQEIEVTEGMVTAGTDAWNDWLSAPVPSPRTGIPFIAKMYRAMERVRREELKGQEGAPYGAKTAERAGDGFLRIVPNQRSGRGRRKGDPK